MCGLVIRLQWQQNVQSVTFQTEFFCIKCDVAFRTVLCVQQVNLQLRLQINFASTGVATTTVQCTVCDFVALNDYRRNLFGRPANGNL